MHPLKPMKLSQRFHCDFETLMAVSPVSIKVILFHRFQMHPLKPMKLSSPVSLRLRSPYEGFTDFGESLEFHRFHRPR